MMDILTAQRKKQQPVELQLTTLVDVVSILILYLVVSTVFGISNLVLPTELKLPESLSKEQMDATPQLLVHGGQITFSESKRQIDVLSFVGEGAQSEAYINHLRSEARKHKKTIGDRPLLLSLIADSRTKYGTIFPIVAKVKRAGFDTVIFVAEGER